VNKLLHYVHALTDEQLAQFAGQDPHDYPSALGPYPAAHEQTPPDKVNEAKHAVAVVDVHADAPVPHLLQTPLFNP